MATRLLNVSCRVKLLTPFSASDEYRIDLEAVDLLVPECFSTPLRVWLGPNATKFDIKTLICQLYFVVFGLLYTKEKMENGPSKKPTIENRKNFIFNANK